MVPRWCDSVGMEPRGGCAYLPRVVTFKMPMPTKATSHRASSCGPQSAAASQCPGVCLHDPTPLPLPLATEVSGLRRKLEVYLSPESDLLKSPWDIGECVGSWIRPNFDTVFYPYTPPHITKPKEIKKVFIVQLPENTYFGVSGVLQVLLLTHLPTWVVIVLERLKL